MLLSVLCGSLGAPMLQINAIRKLLSTTLLWTEFLYDAVGATATLGGLNHSDTQQTQGRPYALASGSISDHAVDEPARLALLAYGTVYAILHSGIGGLATNDVTHQRPLPARNRVSMMHEAQGHAALWRCNDDMLERLRTAAALVPVGYPAVLHPTKHDINRSKLNLIPSCEKIFAATCKLLASLSRHHVPIVPTTAPKLDPPNTHATFVEIGAARTSKPRHLPKDPTYLDYLPPLTAEEEEDRSLKSAPWFPFSDGAYLPTPRESCLAARQQQGAVRCTHIWPMSRVAFFSSLRARAGQGQGQGRRRYGGVRLVESVGCAGVGWAEWRTATSTCDTE
ncbi:hypothetical protein PMIN01_01714 [Paraphaeosphaeria minitans]|uniref:Uncharacterized protein n=1 Tax=Paraphaeosphaeria minitans TaxID=565426 RepID=A0A9P6GQ53_9PLEO|nr:hypothetical protein PMIN01_01714 [Paraphaeosphaeria minitans]